MYSHKSEHGYRRQLSDRSSRHNDERREERATAHRDVPGKSYHKHAGDGHSSRQTETKTNRSREYTGSPKRRYSDDGMSRERSRNSPRGHVYSPDSFTAGPKRRRTDLDDREHRYRRESQEKTYRRSPDRSTSQDSRHRHRPDESTHWKRDHDYRPSSGRRKDGDDGERRWQRSERAFSQERSTKNGKHRERYQSRSRSPEDHRRIRGRLNEPCGQSFESDFTNLSPTAPEQRSVKGFQRFLDVLNKGVNMEMLTKMVTQNSPEAHSEPRSPVSFADSARHTWSPVSAQQQHRGPQNNCHWSEHEDVRRLSSPQPHDRSFSPKPCSLSEERALLRNDEERTDGSRSPSVVETKTITPEDEHKHKQMLEVLQAIGLDLGSEELGQMSHRIRERLYGKKDGGGNREMNTRRAVSLAYPSRSPSPNNSNFIPFIGESHWEKDSYSPERDGPDVYPIQVHQAIEYSHNSGRNSMQEREDCEINSDESAAALQTFSASNTHSTSELPRTPSVPAYSPLDYPQQPYSAPPPPCPAALFSTTPPALPSSQAPPWPPALFSTPPPALPSGPAPPRPSGLFSTPPPGLPPVLPRGLPPGFPPCLPPARLTTPLPPPRQPLLPFPPILPHGLPTGLNLFPNVPQGTPRLFLPPYLPYRHVPPPDMFPAAQLPPGPISNPQSNLLNHLSNLAQQAQRQKVKPRVRCLQLIETKKPGP